MNEKLIKVPYFRQRRPYTCGPVVLQMVLAYFGIRKTRKELIRICGADPKRGTKNRLLAEAAKKLGLKVHFHSRANVNEIKKFLKKGVPVIVNWKEPRYNEGHYSVAIGIKDRTIYLRDPWHGSRYKISLRDFVRRWRGDERGTIRWLMVCFRD